MSWSTLTERAQRRAQSQHLCEQLNVVLKLIAARLAIKSRSNWPSFRTQKRAVRVKRPRLSFLSPVFRCNFQVLNLTLVELLHALRCRGPVE
jgi:hypothetical protein